MCEMGKEMEEMPSLKEMRSNMKNVMVNWNLGPKKASENPKDNRPFWKSIAVKWSITPAEARRRVCGNCEYGRMGPHMLEKMDKYPFSVFDADGGGRVWCEKFDFVCHNLRTCQAWEHR